MEKSRIINNFIWRFAERFGVQIFTFIISIVLARILDPAVYGKVAIVTVFIGILGVFCDCGLGNALIQKSNADDLDFSTVFFTNVIFSSALCALLFTLAPIISHYYEDDELVSLIRTLSFTLPIYGIKNVQQAYVSKNMLFKKFFYSTLSGTIISAVTGIIIAVMGGGAWALIIMQLVNTMIDTAVLWFTVPWRPKKVFSWDRLKILFSYGGRLLASGVLESVYSNLRSLIIGKTYSQESLAYFTKGRTFPDMAVGNINFSIESVMFPVLSKEQNSIEKLKKLTQKTIKTSTFIIFPCLIGIIGIADTLILTLYGRKWAPAIPYIRLFCIYYMLYPFHTANLNAIKAKGRADIIIKQEIAKKIVGLTILAASIKLGVIVIAISLVIEGLIAQIINTVPNKKLIEYGYIDQIKDTAPCFLLSAGMGFLVYLLGNSLPIINPIKLAVQIVIGIIIYFLGSRFADRESFDFVYSFIKQMLKKGMK